MQKFGPNAKMNLSLRTEADRQAILEGLANNTIDVIATNHAPIRLKKSKKGLRLRPLTL